MSALFRLFLIAICACIAVTFGLFFLRTVGGWQSYQGPHHAWAEQKFLLIQKQGCSLSELKQQNTERPTAINWVTIKPGPNASWNVQCSPAYPLSELVKELPQIPYLIEIDSKGDYAYDALKVMLTPMAENRSVGFFSRSHVAIKQLRKEFPQWLFVADPTSLVKIHLFESLFIETLADIWPDVFFTHSDTHSPNHLEPRLLSELQRRKKIIIWDDTQGKAPIPSAISPFVSGVLTTRPTWTEEEFRSK